jgi:hypothetical protein
MRKILLVAFLLFSSALAYAEKIPEALLNAKTAFVRNDGADAKDFAEFCDLLKEWGYFEFVQDRAKADIGITLSTKLQYRTVQLPSTAGGLGGMTTQQVIVSYLRVLNAQNESELWSDHIDSKNPKALVKNLKGKLKKKKK